MWHHLGVHDFPWRICQFGSFKSILEPDHLILICEDFFYPIRSCHICRLWVVTFYSFQHLTDIKTWLGSTIKTSWQFLLGKKVFETYNHDGVWLVTQTMAFDWWFDKLIYVLLAKTSESVCESSYNQSRVPKIRQIRERERETKMLHFKVAKMRYYSLF